MPGTPEARPETILAFDFGRRRIGIAVGQQVTGGATALATVANGENGPDWAAIDRLVGEWQPGRLVVGLPRRADGSSGPLSDTIAAFCDALGRYGRPVDTVDERESSREAAERLARARHEAGRRRVRKGHVDAAAAAVIAERWLGKSE